MDNSLITGVVLARNEQPNIVDCLESFGPHVDELFLIDMESSDKTVALATPFVTKVLRHALIPNFDAARNMAIPEASNDWLWFLDADERVSPETGRLVRRLVQERGHEATAITIPFKTYFGEKWIEHCGWWPGYTMPRVLKRPFFRFGEELHSGVHFQGLELRLPADPELAITHFSYRGVEHYVEKFNRYTSTEALNRSRQGLAPDWRRGVREMIRDLWLYYEKNHGSKDGYHGWVLSWLAGQYRWFSEAKLLDLPQQREAIAQAAVPSSLDEVLAVAQRELMQLRGSSPSLPWEVHFRSPLLDPSGYADDGRTILKALALLDRAVSAQAIPWSDKPLAMSAAEGGLLKTLLRTQPGNHYLAITNCIPTLCEPDPEGAHNILRTTFETDRIPGSWLPRLEPYDEIWVCARHNATAFRRSGVAPEKLRVLPQGVDTSLFCPEGSRHTRPPELLNRFVFLSVFDWQLRKGWDVLLRSYCREFSADEGVGLWLKVSHMHGHTPETIRSQAEELLRTLGQSLESRPDIVIWSELLPAAEMAALYRSADVFVLASHGEGWGRPYLEAMACGIPTIGTTGSGNDDFMTAENSWLVETDPVPVPEWAAREIPVYQGHVWREPREVSFRQALRAVWRDQTTRERIARRGTSDAHSRFSIESLSRILGSHLQNMVAKYQPPQVPPATPDQIRVELEGEFFASHSFSNINEQLAQHWSWNSSLALSLRRRVQHPTNDRAPGAARLVGYLNRPLPGGPQVVIRHAFPPNWNPPVQGKWVHIQPWEFGYLPEDWIAPLRDQVDEIWAPSEYVRDVYLRSGIPAEKIQVIPWGIDPAVYSPSAPDRILPTQKKFKFLFVGGTIGRKGFDLVLAAYLAEFQRHEDVCLVIKDLGTQTFYRYGNYRQQIFEALANPAAPEIVYLDSDLTEGQRASLYTACHCFVAPYRGEGFGLPILEAMACGLPSIIPRGGPTDDFAGEETAFILPSQTVSCPHDWKLCGEPTELAIDLADLRRAMRQAYADQPTTRRKGEAASERARGNFTWEQAIRRMTDRIEALASSPSVAANFIPTAEPPPPPLLSKQDLSVCLLLRDGETTLADCLSRIAPFAKELIVGDLGTRDRSVRIAQEYGATVLDLAQVDPLAAQVKLLEHATQPWILAWETHELFTDADLEHLLEEMNAPTSAGSNGQFRERLMRNPRPSVRLPVFHPQPKAELPLPQPTPPLPATSSSPLSLDFPVPQGRRTRDPHALFERGILHFAQGNYFHAECYFTQSLNQIAEGSPLHRDVLAGLVAAYHKTGDPYWAAEFTERFGQIYQSAPSPFAVAGNASQEKETRLYLGAGQKRLSDYLHVDIVPGVGIEVAHNLDERPWPWGDSSVAQIVAEDLVEHLSVNLIEFCNEAWRVLQPGGELFIRTPHCQGESSWIDPTHRWHLHDQSFQYVDPETFWGRTYPHYTRFKWEILSLGVRGPQNIHALLTPRKELP